MPEATTAPFEAASMARSPRVAVLLPAYNEALAIGPVIDAFRAALPAATIYVYDNNSRDGTADIARAHGAVVRTERRQGKGYVVRRMFADIDADVYLMCDADATYDAAAAPAMVDLLLHEGLDMVVGTRSAISDTAYRPAHAFGNWMLTGIVRVIFGNTFTDMLSGYRVFSRRFIKSFPITSQGFEIETELTIHALELQMPVDEVATRFTDRPVGSLSKLSTVRDGLRILGTIIGLLKLERPFHLFGIVGSLFMFLSVAAGSPVVAEFLRTGLVPRMPTTVLATGLMIIGWFSVFSGLILDSVTRARQEVKRLRYLELEGTHAFAEATGAARPGTDAP